MPFSISGGVRLMCLAALLILPEQGRPQCYVPRPRFGSHVVPPCCLAVSNGTIRVPVDSCLEQRKESPCGIHAFVFKTKTQEFCVDPRAPWLPQRFQRLQSRGICCHVF